MTFPQFEKQKRLRFAAATLLAACALSGCKHDPNVQKQKYLESGTRYETDGKYREATIQFSNALKVDHNFAPAHYELAKTYLKLGSVIAAYQELQRTVSLNPGNVQARLDLGNMLLAGGLPDRAKEQANAVLGAQPNNADAYALLAHVAQKQGDNAQALTLIGRALAIDPQRSSFHTSLGVLQAITPGSDKSGEAELQQAIALNTKDPSARIAFAELLAKKGDMKGAQEQMQAAVGDSPKDIQPRALLAALYLKQNNQAGAEQTLIQAVKDLPDADQPATLLLTYYGRSRQIPLAESTFASLHGSLPKSIPVATEYARVLMMESKYDPARDVLKELSKVSGSKPEVQRLNADMLMHDGKPNDAFTLLQKAVGSAPDDVRLRLMLAQVAASLGKSGVAETNLREAARLDPRNLEAARGLAGIAFSHADFSQLSQLATQAINFHPDAPDGYLWRGATEAKQQQLNDAENDFQTVLKKDPSNAVAMLDLGELRLAQKKTAEGRVLLEQTLARDPNQIMALNLLVSLALSDKQPDKAFALIQTQIAKSPNNPALYTDLSALQLQLKNFPAAQASAQKALAINKAYEPALQVYAQAQVAQGNTDAAISTWQQWFSTHPDDARAAMLLGTLEETKGDLNKAIEYDKKALQLDPSQAVAANNLAYLLLETNQNSDVALSYAETARRLLPNSPDTADTLAWVYFHKGTYSLAKDLLEDAAKAEPNNASIHYHLGMTYSKLGNKADATAQLKKATELAPNTQTAKDASVALSGLG